MIGSAKRRAVRSARETLRTNPLLGLLARHLAIGAVVALGVLGLLLIGDVARLRTLLFASDIPWIAVALLASGFVVTFASAAAGSAVMALGTESDGDLGRPDGRRHDAAPLPRGLAAAYSRRR